MKISQILETQDQQQDEGAVADVGRAVGGAIGKTTNAIGAVAGGVKGAWDAAKAGFNQGKNFVGGQSFANDEEPASGGGQQQSGGGGGYKQPNARTINQQGPAGTAPAQNVQGSAGTAMGNMGKAMSGQKPAQAGATLYATVKQQINNLDPQSKQKLLTLVQKSVQQKQPKQGGQQSGAMGQMANALTGGGQQAPAQPNTMANAPVSASNTAKPGNPNAQQAAPAGQAPAGQPAQQTAAPAGQPPAAAPAAQPNLQVQQGGKAPAAGEQPAGKMDPKSANALKARLKAGQGAGSKTGGGFKNYVAGSQEKFQGADASGAPVFKKLQREGAYGFESKFFGGLI
jgi:hypothetical protein